LKGVVARHLDRFALREAPLQFAARSPDYGAGSTIAMPGIASPAR